MTPENQREAARELGDLKENAEYHMAKDDQKVLLARQAELQADLMRAQATDFTDAPQDTAGIGSIVDLKDLGSGETFKYTIFSVLFHTPKLTKYNDWHYKYAAS